MATRFSNPDILEHLTNRGSLVGKRHFGKRLGIIQITDHLLEKNHMREALLKITVKSNENKAVKWIIGQLTNVPQTQEVRDSVASYFRTAIKSEKRDTLRSLTLWPNLGWIRNQTYCLINQGASIRRPNIQIQTAFEYSVSSGVEDIINLLAKQKPDLVGLNSLIEAALYRNFPEFLLDIGTYLSAIMISVAMYITPTR
ncbi:hypothetical protein NA56DRAFT_708839 [Hyaloscypha hepaticicola]|uniref:Uncharacterized protein n=1 Tax=Hyaloscypha hepaticicola TaxID=2082293 RepID=A0A2J6PQH7_9HELO|nr:hypothetical protein NA56DRAFT_708839 [Hyaloscypha hepaticicola]